MITNELKDYVQTKITSGSTKEELTTELSKVGWTEEQIHEVFAVVEQASVAPEVLSQPVVTEQVVSEAVPNSLKYFAWLMYGSLALAVGAFVLKSGWQLSEFGSRNIQFIVLNLLLGSLPFLALITFKLVAVITLVKKRADWAKIVLILLIAIGFLSSFSSFYMIFMISFNGLYALLAAATLLPFLIEALALYFLFRPESMAWLQPNKPTTTALSQNATNNKWLKVIPWINYVAMIISVLLLFVVDLYILIQSPELAVFFYIMLGVFAIFLTFFFYEHKILKNKLASSTSALDNWLIALVVIRDIVFILNFIPFVQILGGFLLVFGGVPYLIAYIWIVWARLRSAQKAAQHQVSQLSA